VNDRRLESLTERHAVVDAALADELKRPLPDLALVRTLKRRKLQLKDEMTSMGPPSPRSA
jgi:hypothetical protein